jgi:hypothetical protein
MKEQQIRTSNITREDFIVFMRLIAILAPSLDGHYPRVSSIGIQLHSNHTA